MLMKTLCFFGLGMASALHLPTCTGRRGALASAAALGLPAAALALPAFEKEGIEGLRPETKKKRMKPDGFGGFVERDEEVKSVAGRLIDKVGGDDDAPTQRAARKCRRLEPAFKLAGAASHLHRSRASAHP